MMRQIHVYTYNNYTLHGWGLGVVVNAVTVRELATRFL